MNSIETNIYLHKASKAMAEACKRRSQGDLDGAAQEIRRAEYFKEIAQGITSKIEHQIDPLTPQI